MTRTCANVFGLVEFMMVQFPEVIDQLENANPVFSVALIEVLAGTKKFDELPVALPSVAFELTDKLAVS